MRAAAWMCRMALSATSPRCWTFQGSARAAIAADNDLFEVAATGGDDYELLASSSRESAVAFEAAAAAAGVPLTFVGEAVEGQRPPKFIGPDGNPVVFEHGSY